MKPLTPEEICEYIQTHPGCIVELFPEEEQPFVNEALLCNPSDWETGSEIGIEWDEGVWCFENHNPNLKHEGIRAIRDEDYPDTEISFEGAG